MRYRHRLVVGVTLGVTLSLALATAAPLASSPEIPASLTDQEFWKLIDDMSETNGTFKSDNLLSNETVFAKVVPLLQAAVQPGGVYLGVGPEQNFTYISHTRPKIAFITDVRRGNLQLQLMYKALFELSPTRADFVGRLFTKSRPTGLSTSSTARDIMDAYWDVVTPPDAPYQQNLTAIYDLLEKTHHTKLSDEDRRGIDYVYSKFYYYGPLINYTSSTSGSAGRGTSYYELMVQPANSNPGLSYLATEEQYTVMRDLEKKNLLIPLVGNFAGPKALRAVGQYVRDHGATVSMFYVSNVEQYLNTDRIWPVFCANVASMPLDEHSVFIRPMGASMTMISTPMSSATTVNGATRFGPTPTPQRGPATPVPSMLEESRGCK